MSFGGIMANGVAGMTAQTKALGAISDNIANSQTVGYKPVEAQFSDFFIQDRSGRASGVTGAGVSTDFRTRMDLSNGISQTEQTTNAAILGNGFFVVQELADDLNSATVTSSELTSDGDEPQLTRAGDFSPDLYGHLVNSTGRALLGVPLIGDDAVEDGTVSDVDSLQLVSIAGMKDYVEATSTLKVSGNLPSITDTTSTTANTGKLMVKAVDGEGAIANVALTFTRSAVNSDNSSTWDVSATSATYEDGTAVSGFSSASIATLAFDSSGRVTGGAATENAKGTLNLGGSFDAITVDFGSYGSWASLTAMPGVDQQSMGYQENGVAAGTYVDTSLTENGYVRATYSGGQTRDFFRIPNAMVTNAQDLENVSGTAFQTTETSGDIRLKSFGVASSGATAANAKTVDTVGATLGVGEVEMSGTDIASQFTNLIMAQRTYSANSKSISTADEMSQTTIGLKS